MNSVDQNDFVNIQVVLPKVILDKLRRLNLDPEVFIIDLLLRELSLDPHEEAIVHLELAERFLEEGKKLIDKDPVQASEKLYEAVEECVEALAVYLGLIEILERAKSRGRWTVTDLEKTVCEVAKKIGEDIRIAWDSANYLHVWGFREAKLDSEAIRDRVSHIEKIVHKVREYIQKRRHTN